MSTTRPEKADVTGPTAWLRAATVHWSKLMTCRCRVGAGLD